MSKEDAKKFFEKLRSDKSMQVKIKEGLEKLAKDSGFEATEEELTEELKRRWSCKKTPSRYPEAVVYSEPPGF